MGDLEWECHVVDTAVVSVVRVDVMPDHLEVTSTLKQVSLMRRMWQISSWEIFCVSHVMIRALLHTTVSLINFVQCLFHATNR